MYLAWVAATYMLEGRINPYQPIDPVSRIIFCQDRKYCNWHYLVHTGNTPSLKIRVYRDKAVRYNQVDTRTALTIIAAFAGGLALFVLQNQRTTEPMVIFDVFMQGLSVSIAEVMVCWGLVGSIMQIFYIDYAQQYRICPVNCL